MEFSLDDVPDVVADRIRAATGEPQYLTIRRAGEWIIEALTGDRVIVMRLELEDDQSMSEQTDTFLVHSIERIDAAPEATVTVKTSAQGFTLPISTEFAQMLISARRGN